MKTARLDTDGKIQKMQQTIQIITVALNTLCDFTRQVEAIVAESGVQTGMVNVYVQGATAAVVFHLNGPSFRDDIAQTY